MSNITSADVAHLATLSKFQLSDSEAEALRRDLNQTLDYIKKLDDLDISAVEPTFSTSELENVWRGQDTIDPTLNPESLIDLAPASLDHQIKVPKVL